MIHPIAKSSVPAKFGRSRRLQKLLLVLAVSFGVLFVRTSACMAGLLAQAEITYARVDSSSLRYSVDLQDTGTTPIGTMWFSWVPGEDFLATRPTNIVSPAGWSAIITGGSPGDGFAIQWTTKTPIAAGSVLTGFHFDTGDTPSQLSGLSSSHPSNQVGTTFVYGGAPFSDAGLQIIANPVADPWTNPLNPLDVNQDGLVAPLDALQIINELNANGAHQLAPVPLLPNAPAPFLDTNGDGSVTPLDALLVINELNAHPFTTIQPSAASAVLVASNVVPEPATSGPAALGMGLLLALLIKRRCFASIRICGPAKFPTARAKRIASRAHAELSAVEPTGGPSRNEFG